MGRIVKVFTIFSLSLLLIILAGLIWKSSPILQTHTFNELLFAREWSPRKDLFGFLPFILSTLYVTLIAIIIAIPVSVFTAIFLSEYASKKVLQFASPALDILAGIPSVIFGIWGIIIVVPFIRD